MTVLPVEVRGPGRDAIDRAFETMARERSTGLLIIGDPTVASTGVRSRSSRPEAPPSRVHARDSAEAASLCPTGDFHDLWRRAATYVDKILKGGEAR